MTRGEHGHPEEEGYGTTHVEEIAGRSEIPTERPG
jgi:hypothetical protein